MSIFSDLILQKLSMNCEYHMSIDIVSKKEIICQKLLLFDFHYHSSSMFKEVENIYNDFICILFCG